VGVSLSVRKEGGEREIGRSGSWYGSNRVESSQVKSGKIGNGIIGRAG